MEEDRVEEIIFCYENHNHNLTYQDRYIMRCIHRGGEAFEIELEDSVTPNNSDGIRLAVHANSIQIETLEITLRKLRCSACGAKYDYVQEAEKCCGGGNNG